MQNYNKSIKKKILPQAVWLSDLSLQSVSVTQQLGSDEI